MQIGRNEGKKVFANMYEDMNPLKDCLLLGVMWLIDDLKVLPFCCVVLLFFKFCLPLGFSFQMKVINAGTVFLLYAVP